MIDSAPIDDNMVFVSIMQVSVISYYEKYFFHLKPD